MLSIDESDNSTPLIGWEAPSNIALIKYWGKKAEQLPINPSVSMTLTQCKTSTQVSWKKKKSSGMSFDFTFEGELCPSFHPKIQIFLERVSRSFPELRDYHLSIESQNSFPHSAGIASSASSFAALGLCVHSMERQIKGLAYSPERASEFARLGSGSACRSLFPGYAVWGEWEERYHDQWAQKLSHWGGHFDRLEDTICVVSKERKSVSSSFGHQLMEDHPFLKSRTEQVFNHLSQLLEAMEQNNWEKAGEVIEAEALALHALMMTSKSPFVLMKGQTIQLIEKLWEWRKSRVGAPLYFTLDAGPNIHLLSRECDSKKRDEFLEDFVYPMIGKNAVLFDKMGSGPRELNGHLI